MKPNLQIIIGSTRPGRAAGPVGHWITQRALAHGGFEVGVVDLAEWNLPLLDEPNHPRRRTYTQPHTLRWSAHVDSADAFVFVTPEYNHGYGAALKNAIDYLYWEWHDKPVGFVSYGGASGGTRAVEMLKVVANSVKLVPATEGVALAFISRSLEEGQFHATEHHDRAAKAMLDEVLRLEGALRPLREHAKAGQRG